jgi:23S rRNA pseudouridine1911/1915/1917 synthase
MKKQNHTNPGRANSGKVNPGKIKSGKTSSGRANSGTGKVGTGDMQEGKTKTRIYAVKEPSELLAFLLVALSNQGRNSVKAMLARGQVSVGEKVVTAYNFPLKPGQTVTIGGGKADELPMIGLAIMHEDNDIIIVRKEAGLLSIATDEETELTAYRQLNEHVRRADAKNRIFVVHRLDRDTSGVMMFAKSKEIQQLLQNSWQESVKERTYVALVEGVVRKTEGTISSWLKESKTLKVYSSPYPNDGQHAVTHYKVIKTGPKYTLLEINLETGRKNQIRVHMQDIGHPVVGDKKYGSKSSVLSRLGLHARVLAFTHPRTGEPMRFETDIPGAFLQPFRSHPPK